MLEFGKTNKTNWLCCPCMFLLCCPCGVSLVLVSPWGDLDCFFVLLLLQFYILIVLHSGPILSGWEAWEEHPWCRVVGLILPRCTKQSRTALFFFWAEGPTLLDYRCLTNLTLTNLHTSLLSLISLSHFLVSDSVVPHLTAFSNLLGDISHCIG